MKTERNRSKLDRTGIPALLLACALGAATSTAGTASQWQEQLHITAPRHKSSSYATELKRGEAQPKVVHYARHMEVRMGSPIPFNGSLLLMEGRLHVPLREFVRFLNERFPQINLNVVWDEERKRVYLRQNSAPTRMATNKPPKVRIVPKGASQPEAVEPEAETEDLTPETTEAVIDPFALGIAALGEGKVESALRGFEAAVGPERVAAKGITDFVKQAPKQLGVLLVRHAEEQGQGQLYLNSEAVARDTYLVVLPVGRHTVRWEPADGGAPATMEVEVVSGKARSLEVCP